MVRDGIRAETIRQRISVLGLLTAGSSELTPATILAHCRSRGLAPGTAYQYHSIAAGFMRWARDEQLVDHDPFDRGRRPRKPTYRARPAGSDDIRYVLEHARQPIRSWAILAVYAGLRCGEIAVVSGRDLVPEADGWRLRVPEGKGSKPGSVPAHPLIVEMLVDAEAGRVWPTATAQRVSQKANAHFRALGVRCRMHELRHAFATELYRQTRDVLTVQRALRHEHLETTARYIAFDDDDVKSAIACLSFRAPQRVHPKVAEQKDQDDGDSALQDGVGRVAGG